MIVSVFSENGVGGHQAFEGRIIMRRDSRSSGSRATLVQFPCNLFLRFDMTCLAMRQIQHQQKCNYFSSRIAFISQSKTIVCSSNSTRFRGHALFFGKKFFSRQKCRQPRNQCHSPTQRSDSLYLSQCKRSRTSTLDIYLQLFLIEVGSS
jgi:hypothetical protein